MKFKNILLSFFLLIGIAHAQGNTKKVAKTASPACPTPKLVSEFMQVWINSKNLFTALQSYPKCMVMTKGAPINAVIDSSFAYVKISWIDLGGHNRVSWVIREAVY